MAPEFFQKLNSKNLSDISGCLVDFDNLIIFGKTLEDHNKALNIVLERAREHNIQFNASIIQFCVSKVKYLGNVFNKSGMRPQNDKIRAITEFSEPKNKRILAMINYLRIYIPNLSTIPSPLRELLKKVGMVDRTTNKCF